MNEKDIAISVKADDTRVPIHVSAPSCDWLVYFEGMTLKILSSGCQYPIGVRGYFDTATTYEQ